MFSLELSCFFYDPAYVGNLISGSSAFFETSLNIRKFMIQVWPKSMESYSAINKEWNFAICHSVVDLEGIVLSEIIQINKYKYKYK